MNESIILKVGYTQKKVNEVLRNKLVQCYKGKILKIFENCYSKEIEEFSFEYDEIIIQTCNIFKIKADFGKVKFIGVINEASFEIKNAEEIPSASVESLDSGFVYILKSDLGYKIGQTKNLDDRLNLFNVKLPFHWKLEKSYLLKDYKSFEKFLHSKFEHKRLNGEWFELSEEDLAVIEKLYDLIIS